MRWVLWVASWVLCTQVAAGALYPALPVLIPDLALLQVWAEKTDGAMTWRSRAVSFSLCSGQWSAGSRGPALAAKGSEGVRGSGLLGWERKEVVIWSFTGYETLRYYHPIQSQSIPQRKEGRIIIPILQMKKLRLGQDGGKWSALAAMTQSPQCSL